MNNRQNSDSTSTGSGNSHSASHSSSGKDFADFVVGSGRLNTEEAMPLPEEHGYTPAPQGTSSAQEIQDSSTTDADTAVSSTHSANPSSEKKRNIIEDPRNIFNNSADQEIRDRAEVIGTSVRWFSGWCLRFLIMGVAFYFLSRAWSQLWVGILPVLLSLIVCTVLWPIVRTLRSWKFPPALAALAALLSFFTVVIAIFAMITPSSINQGKELVNQATSGINQIQDWLQGPPFNLQNDQFNNALTQVTKALQDKSDIIVTEVTAGATATISAIVTLVLVLMLTFFFLKDGDHFLPMLRRVTGRRVGFHLTEVLTRCWNTLGGFIRTQALVSFIDAFFIGLGLVILQIPLALPLAVITFFGGFIPMVGAFVAGALAVLVALVSTSVTKALITLAIVIAVQQLEGNILQPILQSRAMNIHPAVVLLSVTIGSAIFGIIGAFLAVPAAAMIAVILRYIGDLADLATGEKRAEEIEFATIQGQHSGAESQRSAEIWRQWRRSLRSSSSQEPNTFQKLLSSHREGNEKNS